MEYSISQLAKLTGVSTRTLRYYDEINLLKPKRVSSSGYRIYGQKEVDRLQQILFFRELDVHLETIASILNDPNFDEVKALEEHLKQLILKRSHLEKLIATVEKTIAHEKGEIPMDNEEKFNVFKEKQIEENEMNFGKEIREKYGEDVVKQSNEQFRKMSKERYEKMMKLGDEILSLLQEAVKTGDPASPLAQEVAGKHKEWLLFTLPHYSKEVHMGLADLYVYDERFKAYYDKAAPGGAEFLKDALYIFLK